MAPLTIPSGGLATHHGYYLGSGPKMGVLIVILVAPGKSESEALHLPKKWLIWF